MSTMSMKEERRILLLERIDRASSITDLMPMLKHVDLGEIKRMLKCKIDSPMSDKRQSEIFFDSVSIEQCLPTDVLQHISSFNEAWDIKEVSKTFNKCHRQNARHEVKRKETKIMSVIGKAKHSQTWLVHPTLTDVTNDERTKLPIFEGPINDLQEAINRAQDGDDILLYGGKYDVERLIIDKPLRFIGVGKTKDNKIECEYIKIEENIFCKNIEFIIGKYMNIFKGVTAWFHESDFFLGEDGEVEMESECDIDFTNCSFEGSRYDAITIGSRPINVNIEGCYFHDTGREQEGYPVITVRKPIDLKKINLQRNKFADCNGIPIGLDEQGQFMKDIKHTGVVHLLKSNGNYIKEEDKPSKSAKEVIMGEF